jgi:hypothetical protein
MVDTMKYCQRIEAELGDHVTPGQFTRLPRHLREHLDDCKHCQAYLDDLIILAGPLSRRPPAPPPNPPWNLWWVIAIAALFLIVGLLSARFFWFDKPVLPKHAMLAEQAGLALEERRFQEVIAPAKECIESFEPAATRLQEEIETSGRRFPIGRVDAATRDELLSYGPLNDVAACYLYLGHAHRNLGHDSDARMAYEKAAQFTHARVWDPRPHQKLFWAPAPDAAFWVKKPPEPK